MFDKISEEQMERIGKLLNTMGTIAQDRESKRMDIMDDILKEFKTVNQKLTLLIAVISSLKK